jgi:hypothetical protein
LAWLRLKLWKASSKKYILVDTAHGKIDFDRLDVPPEEEETINAPASETDKHKRNKPAPIICFSTYGTRHPAP